MTGTSFLKPRAVLNEQQAVEIFQVKLAASCPSAERIAALLGISEKAVRDIWKGRTWSRETYHLDPARPMQVKRACGRPRGSKDSRPRNRSRRWISGVLAVLSMPRIQPCRLPATGIRSIDVSKTNKPSNGFQDKHISHRRNVASDSVDYQLHEWSEGTSKPSALVDPFWLDWGRGTPMHQ